MSIEIEFDDSDIEDIEEEIIEDDSEGEEYIPPENEEEEEEDEEEEKTEIENEEEEDIQFDSDEEEDEKDEEGECEETGVDGIDPAEFYEETPKKTAKAIFNRRKRTKPKVSRTIKNKNKKNQEQEIVIQNYMIGNIREISISNFEKLLERSGSSEKNCKILERTVFNNTVRKMEIQLDRKLKKSDLTDDLFRSNYINIVYETFVSISLGLNNSVKDTLKNQIELLNENKTNLNSIGFKDEQFIDYKETKNIEEPPKVVSGIDVCNKCYKDKDRKNDPERGKHTSYYELQTRSQDEPMTRFIECLDCGSKWRN